MLNCRDLLYTQYSYTIHVQYSTVHKSTSNNEYCTRTQKRGTQKSTVLSCPVPGTSTSTVLYSYYLVPVVYVVFR